MQERLRFPQEAKDMVYRGHVENGMIRLEDAPILPEGAEAEVRLLTEGEPREEEEKVPSVCEAIRDFVGKAEGLPPDASINLDTNAPTIEEKLRAIVADVPQEEWDRLPADLSEHLDHYIYGTPK
jgi:hypothetical protein